MNPDQRADRVYLDGHAEGDGRVYQLGMGVMHIHHGEGSRSKRIGGSAVVVSVAAHDAAVSSVFCGRTSEVEELVGLLDPRVDGPGSAVVAVSGLAGMGKTALACHA